MLLPLMFLGCLKALSGGGGGPGPDAETVDDLTDGSPIGQKYDLAANPGCDAWTDTDGTVYEIAGATSWFVGEFGVDGPNVEGFEYWVLYPNDTWTEADGTTDCQVAWYATGTLGDGCPSCDYQLELHMTLELAATNCPDDFVDAFDDDEEEFDVVYNVYVSGGTARFEFASSGNELGRGPAANDKEFAYVTDRACKWF